MLRAKTVFIEIIAILFILLFVYASASKLLDFQNFQAQLGQSPLISAHTGVISYAVLTIELIIAVALGIPKLRTAGLYASYGLMVMFSAYIAIMLGYSTNIPCSCGGILEKMGWKEHLVFNIGACMLAVVAIVIAPHKVESQQTRTKS